MEDDALFNKEILQQQQQAKYTEEDYQREITSLRLQLAALEHEKQLRGPSSSQMMPQSLQQQQYGVTAPTLRKRLPDISKFDGSRKGYPMWKVEVDNKLRIDGAVLGTPQDQAAYLFSRMEAKAQLMVVSFYQNQPDCDARTFVQYLDSIFIDPNAAARALNRLQAMKQGRESFASFLPKFEKELGESQLTMVPDMVKIGYLRGTLNSEMQRAMIGPVTYVDYGMFVQALLAVGSQLDCLQYQKGRATPMAITNRVWPDGDEMDWAPTVQVGKLRRRLTPDEQEKCRQEGRCFLCLKRGHRANDCSSKKGDAQEKIKKEHVEKTTKVRAVKKKNDVVIEEVKEVETSDSEMESENE